MKSSADEQECPTHVQVCVSWSKVASFFLVMNFVVLMTGCWRCHDIGCGAEVLARFDPPLSGESILIDVEIEGRTLTCHYPRDNTPCPDMSLGLSGSQIESLAIYNSTSSEVSFSIVIDGAPPEEYEVTDLKYDTYKPSEHACESCQQTKFTIERQ